MATAEQKSRFNEVYQTALKSGIPHPEVIAAQWALESGWGKKQSGKNNLFGIKAGNGDPNNKEAGTVIWTTENINGKKVKVQQKFRDYDTIDQSIADRAKFTLENPRYRKAGYFEAASPAEAAMALQRGKYATDPKYANILIDVMKSAGINPYNSVQYDNPNRPKPVLEPLPNKEVEQHNMPVQPQSNLENGITYPVQTDIQDATSLPAFEQGYINQASMEVDDNIQRQRYREKLAEAFGTIPSAREGMPEEITNIIRSIYESV